MSVHKRRWKMWLIRVIFLWVEFLCWSSAYNKHNSVAIASIYHKIFCFVFDLIFLVSWVDLVRSLWFLAAEYFYSELTQFEMIIKLFQHNYAELSPTLRINVFLLYLHHRYSQGGTWTMFPKIYYFHILPPLCQFYKNVALRLSEHIDDVQTQTIKVVPPKVI